MMLLCIFPFALAEDGETVQKMETVETLYTALAKTYTLPVYAGEDVTTQTALSLPLYSAGEVTVAVLSLIHI